MTLTPLTAFRLELGDTDESQMLFSDPEAQYFLDNNSGGVLLAVADACDALARRYARQSDTTLTSGDDTVARKLSQVSAAYAKQAADARARAQANAGIPWHGGGSHARKEALREDTDRVQPRFRRGQFRNHRT